MTHAPLDLLDLESQALREDRAALVLADYYEESGRGDDARDLRRVVGGEWDWSPRPDKTRKRIDRMTSAESAQMADFAREWIRIGVKTGLTTATDKLRFAHAIRAAYKSAKLAAPKRIIWTTSPVAVVLAGPIAMHSLMTDVAVRGAVRDAVRGAVGDSVDVAVRDAVRVAVGDAVGGAVRDAVRDAVGDAVGGAVGDAVGDAVRGARSTIASWWSHYLGGQPWVGWSYYRGPAYVAFCTDVLRLELSADKMAAARAYRAICETCWWLWPHSDYVIVAPRPRVLSLDDAGKLIRAEWDDGSAVKPQKNGGHRLNVNVTTVLGAPRKARAT